MFILTSSDYNWQQCAELTLDSALDLSVAMMQKEREEKSARYVTIASGQENCKRFLSQKEMQPQFSILFKNVHDYCKNYTCMLTFLLSNKLAPSANILVQQLLKVGFLTM